MTKRKTGPEQAALIITSGGPYLFVVIHLSKRRNLGDFVFGDT